MSSENKIKVCLVCVCYNAYEDTLRLLNSIEHAFSIVSDLALTVVLSDNSTSVQGAKLIERVNFSYNYIYIKNDNVGYFPAFNLGVKATKECVEDFDYIIVSNVDLAMDSDFFNSLKSLKLKNNIGLVAPKIISDSSGNDSNPKMKSRPTKRQISIMRLLCSSPVLFSLYQKLSILKLNFRKQPKNTITGTNNDVRMYGAHGAFMIFTQMYFEAKARIDYPRFLFGEEGFVAEELRKYSLKIQHETNLVIYDKEHGSTSTQPSKFICKEHKKSYDYFYENYMK
jgi:GT2 family glycosyltransferase